MYLLVPERKSIMFLKQCFTRSFNHTLSYLHSCFVSKSGDVGSFTYSFGPTSCFPLFPTSGREYSTLGSNSSIHSSEVCFVPPCQAHLHPRSPPTLVPCTSHILTPGFLHSCCFSLPEFCQQSQLLHVFWLTVTKPQFQSQSPFVDSQSFLCYLFPCFQTQLFCPDFFSSSSASAHSPTFFLILHWYQPIPLFTNTAFTFNESHNKKCFDITHHFYFSLSILLSQMQHTSESCHHRDHQALCVLHPFHPGCW